MHHDVQHHGGDFGAYMRDKIRKQRRQFRGDVSDTASRIFQGVCIFVDGRTSPPVEELRPLIISHGGFFETYETQQVTHVIASNLPDSKRKRMYAKKKLRRPVLSPQWIADSIAAGKRLPIHSYSLIAAHSPVLRFPAAEKHSQGRARLLATHLAYRASRAAQAKQDLETPQLFLHLWVPQMLVSLEPKAVAMLPMEACEHCRRVARAKVPPWDEFVNVAERVSAVVESQCLAVEYVSLCEWFGTVLVSSTAAAEEILGRLQREVGIHAHAGVGASKEEALRRSGVQLGNRLISLSNIPSRLEVSRKVLSASLRLDRAPKDTLELTDCAHRVWEELQVVTRNPALKIAVLTQSLMLKLCSCEECDWLSGSQRQKCPKFSRVLRGRGCSFDKDAAKDILHGAQRLSRVQLEDVTAVAFTVEVGEDVHNGIGDENVETADVQENIRTVLEATHGTSKDVDKVIDEVVDKGAFDDKYRNESEDANASEVMRDDNEEAEASNAAADVKRGSGAARKQYATREKKSQSTIMDQWKMSDMREKALGGEFLAPGQQTAIDPTVFKALPAHLQREILRDIKAGRQTDGANGNETTETTLLSSRQLDPPPLKRRRPNGSDTDALRVEFVEEDGPLFNAKKQVAELRVALRSWISGAQEPSMVHCQLLIMFLENLVECRALEEAEVFYRYTLSLLASVSAWRPFIPQFEKHCARVLEFHGYGTFCSDND